jgi:hypothetical protein
MQKADGTRWFPPADPRRPESSNLTGQHFVSTATWRNSVLLVRLTFFRGPSALGFIYAPHIGWMLGLEATAHETECITD